MLPDSPPTHCRIPSQRRDVTAAVATITRPLLDNRASDPPMRLRATLTSGMGWETPNARTS